ncbi:sugar-transfer associated ATP-grasp domain-containing protein [Halegenticoccus soli]|uniref:sugar-transfer associated ATP-grasp domain-containing protein n=1 Tax=Halegenticoccus soli TaxID=1985678 RepID=UPI001179C33D|nr:sugar-transfer associated ATP-grasp domain-containing protein [Halegenticoccus soli]
MDPSQAAEKLYKAARRSVPDATQRLHEVANAIEGEVATMSEYQLPPRRRLWLWRHGFQSRTAAFYDFDAYGPEQYLSDLQIQRTGRINGRWRTVFENKLVFHWMMRAFPAHQSTVHGVLRGGEFRAPDLSAASRPTRVSAIPSGVGTVGSEVENGAAEPGGTDAGEWFAEELTAGDRFVLKPIFGGFGKDVHICSKADGGYVVDGEPTSAGAFESFVDDLDEYLVSAFVEQADYADAFFPDTPNTLRVMTMWDYEADEPFIPIATQRIGSSHSAPLDNWSQGGVMSEIDVETGELGPATTKPAYGTDWHARHPETGAQIEGVRIPGWEEIREGMLEIADAFSQAPYAGWDVVVTGEGEFTIVEGNNKPSIQAMQTYRPLLADPRVRRFYEHHGVV